MKATFWVGRETYLAHEDTFAVYFQTVTGQAVPATMTDEEKARFLNDRAQED